VRLIPCLMRAQAVQGASALAGLGTTVGTGVRTAAASATDASRTAIEVLGERASRTAAAVQDGLGDHVVAPFSEGVARVTGGAHNGKSDGRDVFFLGIGMVVGLLYAAILSLWLFVVRPRWSTR
jgi:hypothetical protein